MNTQASVLLEHLTFPEGPRWHDGKLWFSDFFSKCVMTVDMDGHTEHIADVPGQPSGLGWLPDGQLLIVSMMDRRLLRLESHAVVEAADLSDLATGPCNDMVVDAQGRAYVGNMGFNLWDSSAMPAMANLVMVLPDGKKTVVAEEMGFPNGTVITPDGKTLIVAETGAGRLTAFDIEANGSLTKRRIWAAFDDAGFALPYEGRITPDGICLDAKGGIWVASPGIGQALRVLEGGEITHRIDLDMDPFGIMLGGDDGHTLFLLGSTEPDHIKATERQTGRIEMLHVDVPSAGLM